MGLLCLCVSLTKYIIVSFVCIKSPKVELQPPSIRITESSLLPESKINGSFLHPDIKVYLPWASPKFCKDVFAEILIVLKFLDHILKKTAKRFFILSFGNLNLKKFSSHMRNWCCSLKVASGSRLFFKEIQVIF